MARDLDLDTASWPRRLLALVVDWVACTCITAALIGGFDDYYGGDNRWASFATLGIFVLESALLTASSGGSFGQLATRLRVIRDNGTTRPPDLLRALGRQVLIALVIPPIVYRPDGRGLHDILMGTATVDLQTFLARRPATRKAP